MNPNDEAELRLITLTTMPRLLKECQSPFCKNKQLAWFYDQVRGIMERNQKKGGLEDGK
jgi:hypothetical protein